MRLRDIIDSPCGMRYMLEELPLSCSFSSTYLLNTELASDAGTVEGRYSLVRHYSAILKRENSNALINLRHRFFTLKDIGRTIDRIASDDTVDDIELYEVKHLILTGIHIHDILVECQISPDGIDKEMLHEALHILDPHDEMVDAFYVYDFYSAELTRIREAISKENSAERLEYLKQEELIEQIRIRGEICSRLRPFCSHLRSLLVTLIECDIAIAKGEQIASLGLVIPEVTDGGSCELISLFHPLVKSSLAAAGKEFTPVDISFCDRPVVITGANMGGKTVVLKMVTLSYYLMLMGMGVPAAKAVIPFRSSIFFVCGDSQNIESGLSSFAAEMKSIDMAIAASEDVRKCSDMLVLVDEPARSTNPLEGTALVEALVSIFSARHVNTLITTHYNIKAEGCDLYRVRGFENGKMNYRLFRTDLSEVPREALRVAAMMGISPYWIQMAEEQLKSAEGLKNN